MATLGAICHYLKMTLPDSYRDRLGVYGCLQFSIQHDSIYVIGRQSPTALVRALQRHASGWAHLSATLWCLVEEVV